MDELQVETRPRTRSFLHLCFSFLFLGMAMVWWLTRPRTDQNTKSPFFPPSLLSFPFLYTPLTVQHSVPINQSDRIPGLRNWILDEGVAPARGFGVSMLTVDLTGVDRISISSHGHLYL
ncbi:hypothetical protein BDV37DRAFT_197324 [Aspergillus pseudonomiae]|uniref:Uncharacterized protein n=1 Tax=Aspergillus pseudonomiae TaxID=1506151 RepID=A0A5N7D4F0_9EURO|nr:uncharacterized protein BDV37DRAFT_197324 [Aspergillus pseudonomiae]KAE8400723.1 hypothetical protein BDV37DRAFT_197324 [Aspergillus pseudonomiae]